MIDLIEETHFEDISLNCIILTNDTLASKHFIDTVFENCDFSSTTFDNCTFINCTFTNCNLGLIKIPECKFENCTFIKCKMLGINWTVVNWKRMNPKKKSNFNLYFKDCFLNFNLFISLNIINGKFDNCCLKDVCFENANMQGTDFTNSDLVGAIFDQTNLKEANLSRAINYRIDAQKNIISRAKFSLPEAMSLIYALDIEVE